LFRSGCIFYIKRGLSPELNPRFGVLRFGLSCDSTLHVTVVSMNLLNFYQNLHSGVNDSAVHVTAVSMTPLCMSQRCQ
jgi:hypothetical protein